jgi:hypothetical protein
VSVFSDQQQKALEKAYSDLGEKFEGVLIVVLAEVEKGNSSQEASKVYYYGGRMQALGLAMEAQKAIQDEKAREPDVRG